jgi:hypothetical protein
MSCSHLHDYVKSRLSFCRGGLARDGWRVSGQEDGGRPIPRLQLSRRVHVQLQSQTLSERGGVHTMKGPVSYQVRNRHQRCTLELGPRTRRQQPQPRLCPPRWRQHKRSHRHDIRHSISEFHDARIAKVGTRRRGMRDFRLLSKHESPWRTCMPMTGAWKPSRFLSARTLALSSRLGVTTCCR